VVEMKPGERHAIVLNPARVVLRKFFASQIFLRQLRETVADRREIADEPRGVLPAIEEHPQRFGISFGGSAGFRTTPRQILQLLLHLLGTIAPSALFQV